MRRHLERLVAAILLFVPTSSIAQEYVFNAFGHSGKYNVFTADADGWVNSFTPVPTPSGSLHVAWPSAVARNGVTALFASLYATKWGSIGRWTRTGTTWSYHGPVLSSDANEPHGIGPAWVGYDQAASQWLMYYTVRNPAAGAVHRATSPDGISWVRHGTILAPVSSAPGGYSMSYACRDDDGHYYLVVHGYNDDLSTGKAMIAKAASNAGPFSPPTVVLSGDNFASTTWGRSGNALLAFPAGVVAPTGIPLVIASDEVVVVQKQVGNTAYLKWPLRADYTWATIVSAGARKVDLSYIRRSGSGWTGIITMYGATGAVTNEFTSGVRASSPMGPWALARDGLSINPFFAEGRRSAENPQTISADMSCRN